MIRILRLKASNFRGIGDSLAVDFSAPMTVLHGPNGAGKSSVLNAVEWCLFGGQIAKAECGIAERAGWEVARRGADADGVFVECVFQIPEGATVSVSRKGWMGRKNPELANAAEVKVSGADRVLTGVDAQREIEKTFGTFPEFMATVHQHQEVVRFMIAASAADRSRAIDLLLGLAGPSALAQALRSIGWEKQLGGAAQIVQGRVAQEIGRAGRNAMDDRRRAVEDLAEVGITDPPGETLSERLLDDLRCVIDRLAEACGGAKGPLPDLAPDSPDATQRAVDFARRLFRDSAPSKEIQELRSRRDKLLDRQRAVQERRELHRRAMEELTAFCKEHGDREQIAAEESRILKEQQALAARLQFLSPRLDFVEKGLEQLVAAHIEHSSAEKCPLCAQDATGLREQLGQEIERLRTTEIARTKAALERCIAKAARLQKLLDRLDELENQTVCCGQDINKAEAEAFAVLGIEADPKLDPERLLAAELERLEERIARLKKQLDEPLRLLQDVEAAASRLDHARDALAACQALERLDALPDLPEWAAFEEALRNLSLLAFDLSAITEKARADLLRESRRLCGDVGTEVNRLFCDIAAHPDIGGVQLRVSSKHGRNDYALQDGRGRDLLPVLSQGHANALALSVFMGLVLRSPEPRFGVVLFDDPSQSLGEDQIDRLAFAIDQLARERQVILATMDDRMRRAVERRSTCRRRTLAFHPWDRASGVSFDEEAA